jgi:hypothetical protein
VTKDVIAYGRLNEIQDEAAQFVIIYAEYLLGTEKTSAHKYFGGIGGKTKKCDYACGYPTGIGRACLVAVAKYEQRPV